MKVAVFGAGGQLGQALQEVLRAAPGCELSAFTRTEVDVSDPRAVEQAVEASRPDVVVNAAAMTDVDGCERDHQAAYRANALAARWLARSAERQGAALVHVSTDYVFDGEKGSSYHEWDATRPIQVYGESKLAGEAEVRAHCPRHLIARTSWLYGGPKKGFVRAILGRAKSGQPLSVVTDQAGSPSYIGDVARAIWALLGVGAVGTVHLANEGRATRHAFAQEIVRQAGLRVEVEPTLTAPDTSRAARPKDTSLESFVLASAGVRMPPWQEGLASFLRDKEV